MVNFFEANTINDEAKIKLIRYYQKTRTSYCLRFPNDRSFKKLSAILFDNYFEPKMLHFAEHIKHGKRNDETMKALLNGAHV